MSGLNRIELHMFDSNIAKRTACPTPLLGRAQEKRSRMKARALVSFFVCVTPFEIWILYAHRHHDVLVFVVTVFRRPKFCLGVSILELKRDLAFAHDVKKLLQVLGVETNVGFFACVVCLNCFVSFTLFSILRTYYQLIRFEMKANCM